MKVGREISVLLSKKKPVFLNVKYMIWYFISKATHTILSSAFCKIINMELIYYFVYCCSPPQKLNSVFRAHYSTSHLLNNALSVAFSYLHNENSSPSEKDEGNDLDEEVIQVGQVYSCCILTSFTYPMGHICIQQWRGAAENITKKIRLGKCVSVQRRSRAACGNRLP